MAAYAGAGDELSAALEDDLGAEIERLAMLVAELLPQAPEALGRAALVLQARGSMPGRGGAALAAGHRAVGLCPDRAWGLGRSGPDQVMAAVQLTHARRAFDGVTDWSAVLQLYDVLLMLRPAPMVALSRALALAQTEGVKVGLAALSDLPAERLALAWPYHIARADLQARAGRSGEEAAAAHGAVLALTPPRAERLWQEKRRAAL